jgi:hypothetical protein
MVSHTATLTPSMSGSACLLETILFSSDFRAVDEPLHSAVHLFDTIYGKDVMMPPFVKPAFEMVKSSANLNPKRALWLVLMRVLPPIAEYAIANARQPVRASALGGWLETEVERLFTGAYHAYDSPLDEFVSGAQVFYNT